MKLPNIYNVSSVTEELNIKVDFTWINLNKNNHTELVTLYWTEQFWGICTVQDKED